MRILVLGGTTEASALVERLAWRPRLDVTLSLAGRTAAPRAAPVRTRIGGFGGAEGLAAWLRESRTDLLVDATHPFAAAMAGNALRAAAAAEVVLLAIRRAPWTRQDGDRWTEVGTVGEAAAAIAGLGERRRRVFVTIGRQELATFLAAAPGRHAYLARAIEPIAAAVPAGLAVTELRDRGPFTLAAERAVMREHGIDLLVTKNAGGPATAPKIEAARALGIAVVIVRQPAKPAVAHSVGTAEAALDFIAAHEVPPTERGV